jgi:hypothetical protein
MSVCPRVESARSNSKDSPRCEHQNSAFLPRSNDDHLDDGQARREAILPCQRISLFYLDLDLGLSLRRRRGTLLVLGRLASDRLLALSLLLLLLGLVLLPSSRYGSGQLRSYGDEGLESLLDGKG